MTTNLRIVISHINKLKLNKQHDTLYSFIELIADKLMEQNISDKPRKVFKNKLNTYSEKMLSKESIELFHSISAKSDNDAHNTLREETICACINKEIPSDWKLDIRWIELEAQITDFLNKIVETPIKSITATKKSGRQHNYDILLKVNTEEAEKEIKMEFKYNSDKITNYPEFISVSSNKFIQGLEYASYFYDNYLPKIKELYKTDLDIPNKQDYLKYIYNTNYSKLPLIEYLYKNETQHIKEKKEIVDESIKTYLSQFTLDISCLNKKLQESQDNKVFMLYKSGKFHYDTISKDELTVTSLKEIKNNNTVVCSTLNPTSYIHMLLRWKNHAGILFPAWQIKLVRI